MRQALLLGLCFLFSGSAEVLAKPQLISDTKFQSELNQTKLFEKKREYEKAIKAYEKLRRDYALKAWQIRKARQEEESFKLRMIFSKDKTPGSLIYTVKEGDSLFEIAKKYKTTVELIRKSNQLKKEGHLLKGTKLKIMKDFFEIKVDKSDNFLFLSLNHKPIKRYSVTTGAKNKTPTGKYRIINKVENPTWYWEDKVIPPDSKKNLLGTRWMGFDKESYGIHGTVEPEAIGRQASLGCVRMMNRDVEELYMLIPLGTQVTIVD